MNEELMKVVERAVRPVRAGRSRKLQMRQELLAHLTGLYEEERVRHRDDAAAFEAARDRFGDPVELSRELDKSAGVWGRLAWIDTSLEERLENLFGYREDRSLAWHLGRTFVTSIGICAAIAALVALTATFDPERQIDQIRAISLAPVLLYVVAVIFVVHGSALALVTDFFDRERALWGRALLHCVVCVAMMTALFYAMHWAIEGRDPPLSQLAIVSGVHAIIPIGLIFAVWSSERKARPHREWARLQLDQ